MHTHWKTTEWTDLEVLISFMSHDEREVKGIPIEKIKF